MKIEKPVFIIGTGRSGSTIFHKMLSEHPTLAWTSKLCQFFPANPGLNRCLMQAIDVPGMGAVLKSLISPQENYSFWEYWCRGFSEPCRDLLAEDANPVNRKVTEPLSKMLTAKRNRLLMKITGWPRVGFLRELFPDAKFIHILRDGRAVSSSMLRQSWWWGWRGPENWRWGRLTPAQEQFWRQYNQSFIVLSAIEWMVLLDSYDAAAADLSPDVYKLIRYEDLCADLTGVMKEVVQFCALDWTPDFASRISQYTLTCANDKYKTELNVKQQHDLQEVLAGHLQKHGYE